jgi:hypothetical protein
MTITKSDDEFMFIVTASYEGKIDVRRERRIHAAFKRCGVCLCRSEYGGGDVNWMQNDAATDHEIEIWVDQRERATRLASELRANGLIVNIQKELEQ